MHCSSIFLPTPYCLCQEKMAWLLCAILLNLGMVASHARFSLLQILATALCGDREQRARAASLT